jgi:hypothetical protein
VTQVGGETGTRKKACSTSPARVLSAREGKLGKTTLLGSRSRDLGSNFLQDTFYRGLSVRGFLGPKIDYPKRPVAWVASGTDPTDSTSPRNTARYF